MKTVKIKLVLCILLLAIGLIIYFVSRSPVIKIETTPAYSTYTQCCIVEAKARCINQQGQSVAAVGMDVSHLTQCSSLDALNNQADFSRHQVLTPAELMAVSSCCLEAIEKRCQLLNGHIYRVPISDTDRDVPQCVD